jgi:hypothetical protein
MSANRTGAGSIFWMNQYHRHASDRRFILNKLSQLIKRPRRVLTTLLLFNRFLGALADAL